VRVGVDMDPALLELARARLAGYGVLVQGDLRTVDVGARFDAVIAPYSTLYCLETEADLLAALKRARAHLTDDGIFAFDVWYADDFHEHADPTEPAEWELVTEVEVDGIAHAVEERSQWDRPSQTLVVDYRHTPAGGEPRYGRIVHRYALQSQLERLLDEVGLHVIESGRIETGAGETLAFTTSI
jgi:SAM-dependent methyltransferase